VVGSLVMAILQFVPDSDTETISKITK